MAKIKKNRMEEAVFKKIIGENKYLRYFKELAMSMFEWKNVPPEIDIKFIENELINNGKVAFFYDDILKRYIVSKFSEEGKLDLYNNPQKIHAYSDNNGYSRNLNKDEFVIIYNNALKNAELGDLLIESQRIQKCETAIDINIESQKMPILIKCAENQRMTLKNLIEQHEAGVTLILANDKLELDDQVQILHLKSEYVADRIQTLKSQLWNESLTKMGIENVDNIKKERMITDEVNQNNGKTIASRFSKLNERKNACKKINEKFGLNMQCEFREYQGENLWQNTQQN